MRSVLHRGDRYAVDAVTERQGHDAIAVARSDDVIGPALARRRLPLYEFRLEPRRCRLVHGPPSAHPSAPLLRPAAPTAQLEGATVKSTPEARRRSVRLVHRVLNGGYPGGMHRTLRMSSESRKT